MKLRILAPFVLLLLLAACATSPTGRSQLMLISPQQAIEVSREAYLQTLQPLAWDGKINTDPEINHRVQLITGRIIAQAINLFPGSRQWDWQVTVIDAPDTVNAWCMAGGKMAVYTGLIEKLQPTDDELAQVMAHEVSHALANHTAEKMSVAMATQLGIVGIGIATAGEDYGRGAVVGGALAALLAIQLPNSRAAESEADLLGLELAARAGYDPYAAVSLWQKMAEVGGANPPQFLSTHPAPGNRQATLTSLAPKYLEYYRQEGERPVYRFND